MLPLIVLPLKTPAKFEIFKPEDFNVVIKTCTCENLTSFSNCQWNPKYGCKGTVSTRFALIALVAWTVLV